MISVQANRRAFHHITVFVELQFALLLVIFPRGIADLPEVSCLGFLSSFTVSFSLILPYLSRLMGKPTICIGEDKDADQLRGVITAKLISAFVFATRIVQFLFHLNPKFEALC